MREAGASACTDITGFGLFGHLYRMLRNHGLSATVNGPALPVFTGVLELLRQDIISGAIERNREFAGAYVSAGRDVEEAYLNLGFDAQTSGGLLIAVSPSRLKALEQAFVRRGLKTSVIGEIFPGPTSIRVTAIASSTSDLIRVSPSRGANNAEAQTDHGACCADVFDSAPTSGNAIDSQRAFGGLMRAVAAQGQLDARTKELIIFGLVLQSRCHGCFESHYKRAIELGITKAELDEVAWCAIAMGGAPVKMFYQECCEKSGT
jgi:AhpD family alkylhydroperoxidase